MNEFENKIIEYMKAYSMLDFEGIKSKPSGVVLGVSGGADSVALLSFFVSLRNSAAPKLRLKVVHVNHMIRGEEADSDQRFVENLCTRLKIPYKVYREDIPAMAKRLDMTEEEAGRNYRYKVFRLCVQEMEQKYKCECRIAVAHNKDDLAETVLYNLIRGSSLLGLAGIKPVRDRIIRPLLNTTRAELEEYLKELGQDYVTDSTNLDTEYTRNKIRHLVMPELKKMNSAAVQHIADVAWDAQEFGNDIGDRLLNLHDKENHTPSGVYEYPDGRKQDIYEREEISISQLKNETHLAAGEMILSAIESVCGRRKDITREHLREVYELSERESGKSVDLPYGMIAERVYDRIVIKMRNLTARKDKSDEVEGSIIISRIPYSSALEISKKEYTKMIDCGKIKSTLVLRKPLPDDYIVISKAGGTKKLSRYFTAEKIERERRQDVPVVADGNEIVWVVGMRLSERYKVDSETQTVAVIEYIK